MNNKKLEDEAELSLLYVVSEGEVVVFNIGVDVVSLVGEVEGILYSREK
eukprot:UN08539